MPFQFSQLAIPEVILIEAKIMSDARGFFQETFKASEFAAHGVPALFVQGNHSRSQRGVLRGLHYQLAPYAEGKLVTALRGQIFDVAVDLRRGSPTFGRWVGHELSESNGCLLYIPPGFAHGFCVLSDEPDVFYKTTAEYVPGFGRGICWNDPVIGIVWPTADAQLPMMAEAEINYRYE
jgi:dTDP-4-dehydrorhamnose 3,5-epimerase